MQALVWTAPFEASVEEVDRPHPGADEVELRVVATGVCGSDLHGYRGHSPARVPPLVLGHEVVGSDSSGMLYVVNPLVGCGACRMCDGALPNLCPNRSLLGLNRPGTFAEYVAVPSGNLTPLPEGMTPLLGTLVEPLATPVNALSTVDVRGAVVAVIGTGTIGLLTAYAARLQGAAFIAAYDVDRSRAHHAQAHADVVGGSAEAIRSALLDASASLGADIVIDAVGIGRTWSDALELVRPGGLIAEIGLGQELGEIPIAGTVRKGAMIRGVYAYTPQNFATAMRMLESDPPSLDWVTEADLVQGPELLARSARGDGPVKAIFTFAGRGLPGQSD